MSKVVKRPLYERSVNHVKRYRKLWDPATQKNIYNPIVELLVPQYSPQGDIFWGRQAVTANKAFTRAQEATLYAFKAQARYGALRTATMFYRPARMLRLMRWLAAHGLPYGVYLAWYQRWV